MKTKYLILSGLLLVLAVVLSGCAAGLTATAWPATATDGKNAYVAGGPYVYAVNLQTGAQAWRYPAKASANPFFATPALTSDGQLIIGGYDKKLYSLNIQACQQNPQSCQAAWQFAGAHDRWIGGVLVVKDMLYAPNADYNLYALDLKGNLQWTFTADQAIWGSPVSDGTNVYFGTLGRKVYAVNAKTGNQTWVQNVDGAVLGSPVLGTDGTLYVGSYDDTLYALRTTDGGVAWSATATSWIWSGPALDGTTLYYGDGKGMLYAHSAGSGGQTWNQPLNGAILGTPLISGDSVIIGTEAGSLYFLDRTGKNPRPIPVSGQIYSSPVAAGNLILVAPTGGNATLLALDSTGAIKWSFIPPK